LKGGAAAFLTFFIWFLLSELPEFIWFAGAMKKFRLTAFPY
jgi:hypothetical protein